MPKRETVGEYARRLMSEQGRRLELARRTAPKPWYRSRTLWLLGAFLVVWVATWLMGGGADAAAAIGAAESLILALVRVSTTRAIARPGKREEG